MTNKPKKTQAPNLQRSDEDIAEALRSSAGIVSVAAKKLGLCRQAVYLRIKGSKALREAQEDGRESVDDVAEKTIIDVMQKDRQGKTRLLAAKTWLQSAKSKRGFNVTKVALGGGTGKGGELRPLTIKLVPFEK